MHKTTGSIPSPFFYLSVIVQGMFMRTFESLKLEIMNNDSHHNISLRFKDVNFPFQVNNHAIQNSKGFLMKLTITIKGVALLYMIT